MSEMPNELLLALEYAEDFATAHCIKEQAEAVLIYRDTQGNEFRRSIGATGSREVPQGFADEVILARLRLQPTANDQDLLALDAMLAQAEADGDRVVVIPPDDRRFRDRGDL